MSGAAALVNSWQPKAGKLTSLVFPPYGEWMSRDKGQQVSTQHNMISLFHDFLAIFAMRMLVRQWPRAFLLGAGDGLRGAGSFWSRVAYLMQCGLVCTVAVSLYLASSPPFPPPLRASPLLPSLVSVLFSTKELTNDSGISFSPALLIQAL